MTSFEKEYSNHDIGPFGDCAAIKQGETLRILFQNVNGISSRNNLIATESLAEWAEELQANVLFIVEPNLNFNKKKVSTNGFKTDGIC